MYRNGPDIYVLQTIFGTGQNYVICHILTYKYNRFFNQHKCFIRMKDMVLPNLMFI